MRSGSFVRPLVPRRLRSSAVLGTGILTLVLLLLPACSDDPTAPPPGRLETDFGRLPSTLSEMVVEGGPNPTPLLLNLSNTGSCDLDFTVDWVTTDGKPWLAVSPVSGVLPAGATGMSAKVTATALTVTLDVIGTALYPGTYTGSITIVGSCTSSGTPALGSPARVAVNLTVTAVTATLEVDDDRLEQDLTILSDIWEPLSAGPSLRGAHSAVWTGREMIIWGGSTTDAAAAGLVDGARYYPIAEFWNPTTSAGAPESRTLHTAVWADTKMVVFGGLSAPGGVALSSGAVYDPVTDHWDPTELSGAPTLGQHVAIWTGSEMIVFGNDPAPSGGRFDPSLNSWLPISLAGAPAGLSMTATWTGTQMVVWGDGGGGIYDPTLDTWTPLTGQGHIGPREGHTAVWTGREMIVWGGLEGGVPVATGAIYDPDHFQWSALPVGGAPSARSGHAAVWTGREMLIWGGRDAVGDGLATGGIYSASSGNWYAPSPDQAPAPRADAPAVWTGVEMLIWGGFGSGGGGLADGARYY